MNDIIYCTRTGININAQGCCFYKIKLPTSVSSIRVTFKGLLDYLPPIITRDSV